MAPGLPFPAARRPHRPQPLPAALTPVAAPRGAAMAPPAGCRHLSRRQPAPPGGPAPAQTSPLTLAPIWLPHRPACRCTISSWRRRRLQRGGCGGKSRTNAEMRARRVLQLTLRRRLYTRRCPRQPLLGVQSEAGRRLRLIGCNPVNRAAQGRLLAAPPLFIGPSRPLHSLSKFPLALRSSDHWLFQMIDLCSHWLALRARRQPSAIGRRGRRPGNRRSAAGTGAGGARARRGAGSGGGAAGAGRSPGQAGGARPVALARAQASLCAFRGRPGSSCGVLERRRGSAPFTRTSRGSGPRGAALCPPLSFGGRLLPFLGPQGPHGSWAGAGERVGRGARLQRGGRGAGGAGRGPARQRLAACCGDRAGLAPVALVPWPQELTDPRGATRAAPRSLGNHR